MIDMTIDDRAERFPMFAIEADHSLLLNGVKISRRGLDTNSGAVGINLEVEIGGYFHHILTGEIVAAFRA